MVKLKNKLIRTCYQIKRELTFANSQNKNLALNNCFNIKLRIIRTIINLFESKKAKLNLFLYR